MIPPPSAFAAAASLSNRAIQWSGEGMKPGTIRVIDTGRAHRAAIWRFDPMKKNFMGGGFDLPERLVFSIDKAALPAPFASGERVLWVESGLAFVVEVTPSATTPDETAWKFEARRAPGSDAE